MLRAKQLLISELYLYSLPHEDFKRESLVETILLHDKPGFHGKRLVQKLLIEMLLDVVYENHSHAMIVILWSPCATHHL